MKIARKHSWRDLNYPVPADVAKFSLNLGAR